MDGQAQARTQPQALCPNCNVAVVRRPLLDQIAVPFWIVAAGWMLWNLWSLVHTGRSLAFAEGSVGVLAVASIAKTLNESRQCSSCKVTFGVEPGKAETRTLVAAYLWNFLPIVLWFALLGVAGALILGVIYLVMKLVS